MVFGDEIRSALFPTSTDSRGIGGTSTKIWATSVAPKIVCELSIVDFSIVRSAVLGGNPGDIGGDETTIWYKDVGGGNTIHELSTVDFSSVRNQAISGRGVGGNSSKIWHSDFIAQEIDELSIADFSVVRSVAAPDINTLGIGGDSNKIWHVNYTTMLYELSTVDFSVVRSAASPAGPWGAGGDASTMWLNADIAHTVYEIDVTYPPWSGKISGVVDPAAIAGVLVANIASVKGVV